MNHIPIIDIQNGVQAILEEPLPPLVPLRSSPPRPPSRSNLPRPVTFARPTPKGKSSIRKATSIIKAVEVEAHAIAATLDFEGNDNPPEDILRSLLETAATAVKSGGESLAKVRNQAKAVVDHKNRVLEALRSIDSRISQLGVLLLPVFTERKPIVVETSKFYSFCYFDIGLSFHKATFTRIPLPSLILFRR